MTNKIDVLIYRNKHVAKSFLVKPSEIEKNLHRRYKSNKKNWLTGDGKWPIVFPLGIPTEHQALEYLADVQYWQKIWNEWRGEGEVQWCERRWPNLGIQKLPEKILFNEPLQVARWIDQEKNWQSATQRYTGLLAQWPSLSLAALKYFKVLSEYSEEDFNRLFTVLKWFEEHPKSKMYIRQLPIEGIHTKWIQSRKTMISDLLKTIRGSDESTDFYQLTGILREPELIRFRLLDKELRKIAGGIGDITTTAKDLNSLQLPLQKVYIVENLQTGLAFTDIPGSLVFMSLGYAVELYGRISWLKNIPIFYWGDIDTHGFAILNRLRSYYPHAQSILMDEETLLANKNLWGKEDSAITSSNLSFLTDKENKLYQDLCSHRWAHNLRLEQERILWSYAWNQLFSD